MAYQKLQPSVAAVVITSDTIQLPVPNSSNLSGSNTGPAAVNKLKDSTATFESVSELRKGDIVVNETDLTKALVVSVDSDTEITLSADIFTGTGKAYKIYLTPNFNRSEGCILYIGSDGNVKVETSGGNVVTYVGLKGGTFLPIQVYKVFATGTTSTDLIANW